MSGVIAVLGFGEAGSLIAHDLAAAGAAVRGYDPAVPAPPGVLDTDSDAEAAAGADLVLSVNSAKEAVGAFRAALPAMAPGAIWADLNTASPGIKRELAEIGQAYRIRVTDIAMMAPVPGKGLRVPMIASGEGAEEVAVRLKAFGADIDVLDGPAGVAASKKLLRSVFYKGMAASIVEALEAARAAGCEPWLREHIAEELAKADVATVDRIVTGTGQHAIRRGAEMQAAAQMLAELGVQPLMADASRALHERLATEPLSDADSANVPPGQGAVSLRPRPSARDLRRRRRRAGRRPPIAAPARRPVCPPSSAYQVRPARGPCHDLGSLLVKCDTNDPRSWSPPRWIPPRVWVWEAAGGAGRWTVV